MTFKDSVNMFQIEYNVICRSNGLTELSLNEKEILYYISKAYSELAFIERLIEKTSTINLTAGQSEYDPFGLIITPTQSPDPIISIQSIKIDGCVLDKTSIEDITSCNSTITPLTGKPFKWTINLTNANRKLTVYPTPDKSYADDPTYQLKLYYWEKEYNFDGTSKNSFQSLDFSSSSYGGSFNNPTEWDSLIILKALCNILPISIRQTYIIESERLEDKLKRAKPMYQSNKLTYHLGI